MYAHESCLFWESPRMRDYFLGNEAAGILSLSYNIHDEQIVIVPFARHVGFAITKEWTR